MAKLSTPSGVTVSGKTLSWNEVDNAKRYVIKADGTVIGAVSETKADPLTCRVIFPTVTDAALSVNITRGSNTYEAVSGWTLYSSDKLTIRKMGSTKRLVVNGVEYPADNTTTTINVWDEDVTITLEDASDPSGLNTATVVVNFFTSFNYGDSLMYLGSKRVSAARLAGALVKRAYLGNKQLMSTQDTYRIDGVENNATFVNQYGTPTPIASSIITGESVAFHVSVADHYLAPTVTISPEGAGELSLDQHGDLKLWDGFIMRARGDMIVTASAAIETYAVTFNDTNYTVVGDKSISYNGSVTYQITAKENYALPQTVTVVGATANWTFKSISNGELVLSNPTGAVTVTITAGRIQYPLVENLTNCVSDNSGRTFVYAGMQTSLAYHVITAGFAFPTSISVTNCEYEWIAGSGDLTIKNPTGPVTVTIAAIAKTFTYSVTGTNCTPSKTNGNIKGDQAIDVTFDFESTLFSLAESNISVTNASFSYTESTKTMQLYSAVGNVTAAASAVRIAYALSVGASGCTITRSSDVVSVGSTTTTLTVTASGNYKIDAATKVTVTGATYTWNYSTGKLVLSKATGEVLVAVEAVTVAYSITYNLTNCSIANRPTELLAGGSATLTIKANATWDMPTAVTVTGAASTYTRGTGALVISNPTGAITITASAAAHTYSITGNLFGCTRKSGATTIQSGGNVTWVLEANTGYTLPTTVSITGATRLWNRTSGELKISVPTANVVVTATAIANTYNVAYNLTNCTGDSSNPTTLTHGSTATFMFTAADGYTFSEDEPTVTNAVVDSWEITDSSTAILDIHGVVGDVTITLAAIKKKLSTPTNVTVDGKTVSWDEVPNATKYLIKLDGTEVGTTTEGGGYSITVNITNGTYSGDSRVLPSGTAGVTITANDGYELPDTITVTGATGTWNKTTGTLSISNPTGNVTVMGECVAVGPIIKAGTYVWNNDVDLSAIKDIVGDDYWIGFDFISGGDRFAGGMSFSTKDDIMDGIVYTTSEGEGEYKNINNLTERANVLYAGYSNKKNDFGQYGVTLTYPEDRRYAWVTVTNYKIFTILEDYLEESVEVAQWFAANTTQYAPETDTTAAICNELR